MPVCSLLVLLAAVAPPSVPSGSLELLRAVPDDAAFVLVGVGLDRQVAALRDSPFLAALQKSPLGRTVNQAKEWEDLQKLEEYLRKGLEIEAAHLAEVLPGEALIYAYRNGPPDKPEQEQGLFLVRARKAHLLTDLVNRLNEAQKKSGELRELLPCEHRGVKYWSRRERTDRSFYLQRGPHLLFTGQEAILKDAIDCELDRKPGEKGLFEQQLSELSSNPAGVHFLLNPRAFDALLAEQADKGPGSKTVADYWKALHHLRLSLTWHDEFRLSLAVQGNPKKLPATGQRFFAAPGEASALWAYMPDQPLLAIGSRLDIAGLYAVLGEFSPPELRELGEKEIERSLGAMVGRSIIKEVLPALGPDWGLYLVARDPKEPLPRVLFALRLENNSADPIDEAILDAIHAWAQMAILAHNKSNPEEPARSRTRLLDKSRVRVVEGLPFGLVPAYGLRDGFLVVTSHVDEWARFKKGKSPDPAGSTPLLRVAIGHLADHLHRHREALGEWLAKRDRIPHEVASQRLETLIGILKLFEQLDLRHESSRGRTTLTLTLTPAQALSR
jgi:hypothetical protein